jgi:hypothetical protein
MKALEEMVYTNWDSSDSAPPKARPIEAVPDPALTLLTWDGSAARFPESVLSKFAAGTAAHHEVQSMKAQLIQEFPESAGSGNRTGVGQQTRTRPRATARPDFTIEGGKMPLDVTRLLDLPHQPADGFSVTRRLVQTTKPSSAKNNTSSGLKFKDV